MAAADIVETAQRYLHALIEDGVPVSFAVLYGSHARGESHAWSDIDLMVVSPLFDDKKWEDVNHLWRVTPRVDVRIEPMAVGLRQWAEDDAIPLIEIARREGMIIPPAFSDWPVLSHPCVPDHTQPGTHPAY
ncbi:MAG: nucleotidyltransferase domain-containing protein [Magnetococcales bacterium]|nr:nucleotidyltransferase domain-containing protein [Magnetococcales bacterium]